MRSRRWLLIRFWLLGVACAVAGLLAILGGIGIILSVGQKSQFQLIWPTVGMLVLTLLSAVRVISLKRQLQSERRVREAGEVF